MKHSAKVQLRDLRTARGDRKVVMTVVQRSSLGASTRVPLLGSEAGRTDPQIQSGVLAYRRHAKSGVEVLLVRKRTSTNWGIPKGKLKSKLSSAENAAKEAFEEAGVKGDVEERVAGTYRAVKRQSDKRIVIEVSVHFLKVTKTLTNWPERDLRDVKWCSPQAAAKLLREPVLIELCEQIADDRAGDETPGQEILP
jgi:8-oxo-dGTP pyrophosphatase MutT (NUDIX family)